jgi:hypothetical protein
MNVSEARGRRQMKVSVRHESLRVASKHEILNTSVNGQ